MQCRGHGNIVALSDIGIILQVLAVFENWVVVTESQTQWESSTDIRLVHFAMHMNAYNPCISKPWLFQSVITALLPPI